ncbi:MAG: hypothetical protein JNK82_17975 [Myxococcaceae bacterium]|nr:hypothetical protein [Myxococcaceae bacterium]
MKRALVLLLLAGCRVELKSPVGGACDAEHPCPAGACVGGVCREGSGGGGECPASDAGVALVWSQCTDGFDVERAGTGTLDVGAENVVSAALSAASTDGPTAEAAVPVPLAGFRFRGVLEVKAPFDPQERVSLMSVRAQGTPVLEVLSDEGQRLSVEVQPGALGATQSAGAVMGSALAPGTYFVELSWQRGAAAVLFSNGVEVQRVSASGAAPSMVQADAVRLGVQSLEAGGNPVSIAWSRAELLGR